jgi:hypothetical protein
MSVVIAFQGRRETLSVIPTMTVQVILEKAASVFNVDPKGYSLWTKGNEVDLNTPFRFTGLPNKVTLDLKLRSAKSKKYASAPVTLALSVQGGDSIMGTFAPNTTLAEVLMTFVRDEKLTEEILYSSPSIQYLTQGFEGVTLEQTTLTALGLAGQQVRMKLRHTLVPDDKTKSSLSSTTSVSDSSLSSNFDSKKPFTSMYRAMFGSKEKKAKDEEEQSKATTSSKRGSNSNMSSFLPEYKKDVFRATSGHRLGGDEPPVLDPKSPTCGHSAPGMSGSEPSSPSKVQVEVTEERERKTPEPEPEPLVDLDDVPAPVSITLAVPVTVSTPTPLTISLGILESIRTKSSPTKYQPAIQIMVKYLENMIDNPNELKFRSIKTTNKVFVEKVSSVPDTREFLLSLGFEARSRSLTDNSTSGMDGKGETEFLVLEYLNFDLLSAVLVKLKRYGKAFSKAQAPAPAPSSPTQKQSLSSSSSSFDPYKSHITRNNKQPEREGKSITDEKLDLLNKRRVEIQGSIDSVERETVVFMGVSDSTVSESKSSSLNVADVSDSSVVAASMAKKLKAFGADNDRPLTTKAIRDLEKAKNAKVYKKSLLKVRFPDSVVLQGYFHPKDNMESVHAWVMQSLSSHGEFELFVSPPRQVLISTSAILSGKTSDEPKNLEELGLVPAAIVNLSWQHAPEEFNGELGTYLCADLIGRDVNEVESGPSLQFPVGKSLINKEKRGNSQAKSSDSSLNSDSKSDAKDVTSSKSGGSKGGPKWLKL